MGDCNCDKEGQEGNKNDFQGSTVGDVIIAVSAMALIGWVVWLMLR